MRDTRGSPDEPGSAVGPREHRSPQRPSRYMIGKYEVLAQPLPGSMHMLRYTVSVAGKRIGATASVPTESDCRYMEKPPPVPPLKPFQAAYRPGRPKKSATPQAPAVSETRQGIPPEDVPIGLSLRQLGVG
jgi:hypothetical protein